MLASFAASRFCGLASSRLCVDLKAMFNTKTQRGKRQPNIGNRALCVWTRNLRKIVRFLDIALRRSLPWDSRPKKVNEIASSGKPENCVCNKYYPRQCKIEINNSANTQ
jgi:hypothetical protein